MPIFLIPIIAGLTALAAGGAGVVKGVKGVSDTEDAKRIAKSAEEGHRKAIKKLNRVNEETRKRVLTFSELQQETIDHTLRTFLISWKKIAPRVKGRITSTSVSDDLPRVVSQEDVDIITKQITQYDNVMTAASGGSAATVMAMTAAKGAAASSAIGLAGMLGATASTGTAIGTLSGVAATNATLAWLGGGALAVGGGGMALGAVVLGGLVAAPVLLVAGFSIAKAGEQKLTEARKYESKVAKKIAEIRAGRKTLKRMNGHVRQNHEVFGKLKLRADEELVALTSHSEYPRGENSPLMSDDFVDQFRKVSIFCTALSTMIKNPPIDAEMNLVPKNVDLEAMEVLAQS